MSGLDHAVDPTSDCPSYEWINALILDVLACFRGPTTLDGLFVSKVSILKPDSTLVAVATDSFNHTDRVYHDREGAPQDFFFVYNTFSMTCMLHFPSTNLRWGTFGSLTQRRLNYILTRGRLSKRLGYFVIFLGYNPFLNPYSIIIPDWVLQWVGCLWQVDQGVFVLHLIPCLINILKKNTLKFLWSQTVNHFFMMWNGKPNFLFIGLEHQPDMSPSRVLQWLPRIRKFFACLTSSRIGYLRGSW